jgi:hypothetical protein
MGGLDAQAFARLRRRLAGLGIVKFFAWQIVLELRRCQGATMAFSIKINGIAHSVEVDADGSQPAGAAALSADPVNATGRGPHFRDRILGPGVRAYVVTFG